ncbi:MAG: energy-coupling factor transporter transmembrane component T [Bacteroidota bacterium]
MRNKIPSYLKETESFQSDYAGVKRARLSFLDKTLKKSAYTVKAVYLQAENATKENFIHQINPKVKFISLIYIAVIISIVNDLVSQMLISSFIMLLFLISGLKIIQVYRKIFFLAFIFGFLVVLPASLNLISHGKIIFNIITLDRPRNFWIYHIPQNIGFTLEGIQVVCLMFLRVLNSISFAMLIVFTTSFPAFIKSFKIVLIPDAFLMVISLAYKYIFILSRTIEDTYLALKSRLIGNVRNSNLRKIISGRIFFIFKHSVSNYKNTYNAMVSRGYRGDVKLGLISRLKVKDFVALCIIIVFGICILLI